MTVRFVTREIGSLAKPPWRVKAFAGRPLDASDVDHARSWSGRLGIAGHEELTALLERGSFEASDLATIDDWAARYAIALLERAGLDVVWDGEQRRTEMYDHVIRHARGFESRGLVRSFDNKYYEKAACVASPSIDGAYDVDEYRFVARSSDREPKAPFTGPYTIVDWSYDEHYAPRARLGSGRAAAAEARRRFVREVADQVVRPNVAGVVDAGAGWVQIDEPAATTRPDEVPLVVEGFNASLRGVEARASLHICYSDYRCLWPHVLGLEECFELQLEFANRDSRDLGTRADQRPGYVETLNLFKRHGGPAVGLGVLDIHSDFVEPAELVRDRILYAVDVLDDPARIAVNPDCGLRTRRWEITYEKLARMVEGTRLAEAALNRA